jgi:hypothetical protein
MQGTGTRSKVDTEAVVSKNPARSGREVDPASRTGLNLPLKAIKIVTDGHGEGQQLF